MATYSQAEIEEIIRTVAEQYGIPYWVALGIAGQESSLNPNLPGDGGKSYGLFQIHEIHGVPTEKRKDPWFNATWAMQNSVGPGYQGAIAKGLTDPAQILDDVFRHGQRAAPAAIAAGLPNALQWASTAEDWPGGSINIASLPGYTELGVSGMTSLPERGTVGPDTALAAQAKPVTGEPGAGTTVTGMTNTEQLEYAFDVYKRIAEGDKTVTVAETTVADAILQNAVQGRPTTTQTETYNIADAEADRIYNKYMGELQAGNLQLNEALAGIQRESGVTTRAETMGQEQRAFWDMRLAPGTEYQPGYGPESPIGALRQERGASYQPRPVTQVPTAALSPQTYLQQAQQSFPEVPPVNIPPYPQMPAPTGVGPTTTTTTASGGINPDQLEAIRRFTGGGGAGVPGPLPAGAHLLEQAGIDPREWERIRRGIR